MNPIFKPTPLSWEDIEGGVGEDLREEISKFVWENCYPDEPKRWDDDEELQTDLVFFAETWEKVDGSRDEIATPEQTAAILSLIAGAFHGSWVRDKIVEALTKSATKPQLIEIVAHVASAYCQYVDLKARVELAEERRKMEDKGE